MSTQTLCATVRTLATVLAMLLCSAGSQAESDWSGNTLLQRADKLDSEARQQIKQGSELRKEIKKQRQAVNAIAPGEKRNEAQRTLAAQAQRSLELQKSGGSARKEAAALRADAVDQFAEDMQKRWPMWVTTLDSIQLSERFQSDAPVVGAHNSRARSVHPSKQNLAGSPQTSTAKSMTLALPELSGQQLPKGLDTRSVAISRERQFVAHIEVDKQSVGSDDGGIELNELHRWHLLLTDINGKEISNARIAYRGHMPGHVHGLPTQPRVTEQLANGVYLIAGAKFQMRGWWVIELQLQAEGFIDDSVRFNLNL